MGAAVNEGRCQAAGRCLRCLRLAVTEHIKRRRWRTLSGDVRVVLGSNCSAQVCKRCGPSGRLPPARGRRRSSSTASQSPTPVSSITDPSCMAGISRTRERQRTERSSPTASQSPQRRCGPNGRHGRRRWRGDAGAAASTASQPPTRASITDPSCMKGIGGAGTPATMRPSTASQSVPATDPGFRSPRAPAQSRGVSVRSGDP